ncbi:MAG: Bax inhibitor-1/YccA family protein [Flavobacterium sp.]
MELKSKNPFLKNKAFEQTTTVYDAEGQPIQVIDYNDVMTVGGAINKSFILLVLLVASAGVTWTMFYNGTNPMGLAIAGAVAGFIAVLITVFRPHTARFLAPAYAVFEGLFIGGISAFFEVNYQPGIVINAVGATFVTFVVCFLLYRFKVVKVTEQFKSIVIASTLAIGTYYLITWLLAMFTSFEPVHYGHSLMSIGISAFVIIIAAMNLFLDFDLIDESARKRLPKYMEWFGAMGLMITLVWLYIEFLRLFSKIAGRD